MKKTLSALTALVLLLLWGCQTSESSSEVSLGSVTSIRSEEESFVSDRFYTDESGVYHDRVREETVERILALADNDKSYDELITKAISKKEFLRTFFSGFYNPVVSYNPTIDMIDETFPVECLRTTQGGKVYTIYKSDDGGLFYTFYLDNTMKSHSVYMAKVLQKKDFDGIAVGNRLGDVAAIDPAVSVWTDGDDAIPNLENTWSIHLLKDSLLVVRYTKKNGRFVVSKLEYYDDFLYASYNEVYDFSILPQDYLHE